MPPVRCVLGMSSRVKRLGSGIDNVPSSSAEIKNKWVCTSTPHRGFNACTEKKLSLYSCKLKIVTNLVQIQICVPEK